MAVKGRRRLQVTQTSATFGDRGPFTAGFSSPVHPVTVLPDGLRIDAASASRLLEHIAHHAIPSFSEEGSQ
jgi:hypothetical protein